MLLTYFQHGLLFGKKIYNQIFDYSVNGSTTKLETLSSDNVFRYNRAYNLADLCRRT